jgi:hypothetical protein
MCFTQVVAGVDEKGKVKIRMKEAVYVAQQAVTADGQNVTFYVAELRLTTKRYDLDEVQAFDTEGRRVKAGALSKLLAKEVPALVAAGRHQVDPLHLRLIKPGTLILVLPQPRPVAVPPLPGPRWAPPILPPAVQPPMAQPVLPPLPPAVPVPAVQAPVAGPAGANNVAPPVAALPALPALPVPAVRPVQAGPAGANNVAPPAALPARPAGPKAAPPKS